jgi:molybdopterin molybdotransferase
MKSIGEALREIVPRFPVLGPERVPLIEAGGRVLTEDVHATTELPAFDNSAMDGYAVRHAELHRGPLRLHGESRAGAAALARLPDGCAMRIFTGAPLPPGADTVVIQENATVDDGQVCFDPLPEAGANVRRRGSDLQLGALAVGAGRPLGPGEVGLLAAQGHHTVSVHRRPRVAILSTGDELRDIGHATEPGTIVNTNAYSLAVQARNAGGEPWVLPAAPDTLEEISQRLQQALAADLVLSIGGVSVGEYDFVGQAFERAGIRRHLWKVALKPGKPLLFGTGGDTPVLGLPGNPVSAMVTFEVFVRPGLSRMQGLRAPYAAPIEVELASEHRRRPGRTELARARLDRRAGRLVATLHPLQGSGSLPSMAGVDALVIFPGERELFEAGERLRALPLGAAGRSAEPPFD